MKFTDKTYYYYKGSSVELYITIYRVNKRIRFYFGFTDKLIANNTELFTVESEDIPIKIGGWLNPNFVCDNKLYNVSIQIKDTTNKAVYLNENNQKVWSPFTGSYISAL